MKIMKFITTMEFKSLPENYEKENRGIKPNTVRIVSVEEDAEIQKNIDNIKYIRICNTNEVICKTSFVAEITDITKFHSHGLIIYIFSW